MVMRRTTPRPHRQPSDVAQGFPGGWLAKSPVKAPDDVGLSVARHWEYREDFIFLLYDLAPGLLRQVHESIYPEFLATFESLSTANPEGPFLKDQLPPVPIINSEKGGVRQIPIPGKTLSVTWQELNGEIADFQPLSEAIRSVVSPCCLWVDWFVEFLLDLMVARHAGMLVDFRDPHLREVEVRPFWPSNRPEAVVTWDRIVFDFHCEMTQASDLDFESLKRAIIEEVLEELEEIRPQHRVLRENGRRLKLAKKKRRDHLSWLIQHIIFNRDYVDIAGDATAAADADTIRKGVIAASKELGLTLKSKGRGGKRK